MHTCLQDNKDVLKIFGAFDSLRSTRSQSPKNDFRNVMTAVVDYLQHLRSIEEKDPVLLIVYAYHFYMALLSGGGPILRKMAMKSMNLKEDEGGTEIFNMEGLDSNQYRGVYDNLQLSQEEEVSGINSSDHEYQMRARPTRFCCLTGFLRRCWRM